MEGEFLCELLTASKLMASLGRAQRVCFSLWPGSISSLWRFLSQSHDRVGWGDVATGGAGMLGLEKTEGQASQGLDDKRASTELPMLTARALQALALR